MKKILFFALGLSLLAPSCKDFLQKDNPYRPTDAIFWQSKADFNMALAAIYGQMRGPIYYTQQNSITGNFMSTFASWYDNFTDNSITNSAQDGTKSYLAGNVTPESMPGLVGIYNALYERIARINIFLGKLDEYYTDKNDADYKQFKGEVLALRAINYHYLYIYYGDVPIVQEALSLDNMYREKSDREDVYKAIIKDFDDAIALLPETQTYMQNPGHMTCAAAIGFRARTKLYHVYDENGEPKSTAEMTEILNELKQIKADYTLAEDVLENFISDKQENCPEIMFSLKFLKPDMRNQMDLFVGAWKRVQPTRDLVYAFPNADGSEYEGKKEIEDNMYPDEEALEKERKNIRENLKNQGKTDKEIEEAIKKFDQQKEDELKAVCAEIFENRDPRLYKFIVPSGEYNFAEYFDPGKSKSFTDGNQSTTRFAVRKIVTPLDGIENKSWDDGFTWQSDQDMVLMRYTHILLMMAEAAYESGAVTEAEDYINQLRDRVGMVKITGLDRKKLHNEIRIETCFEGLRYADLKRWRELGKMNGKAHDPSVPKEVVVISSDHFDWPIPYDEIRKAKDQGVTLTQNPGYAK